MTKLRYSTITADLEAKLRHGVYADCAVLPTNAELCGVYRCAQSTLTAALKPLVASGLLGKTSRRTGLTLDRSRFASGMIGLVTGVRWSEKFDFYGLGEAMRADGFEPVMLSVDAQMGFVHLKALFSAGYAGLIFTNSTLTEETAGFLEERKIPFVSCNRLMLHRRLNFVGYDHFEDLRLLARQLADRGYRAPALFFPGRVEGFNAYIKRNWLKLKREFGFRELACDRLILNWRCDSEQQKADFIAFAQRHGDRPDLLLHRGAIVPDEGALWRAGGIDFDRNCRILYVAQPDIVPVPAGIAMQLVDTATLVRESYTVLRELIYAPSQKFIKRFVRVPLRLLAPLPEPY